MTTTVIDIAALAAALAWVGLLFVPWRPCSSQPHLDADARPPDAGPPPHFDDVTVLIPARNEADTLGAALTALQAQGTGLRVVVVDDLSRDDTRQIAGAHADARSGTPRVDRRRHAFDALTVVTGRALPAGWSGKVWAQSQGEAHLLRELTLLLDADIALEPGTLAALRSRLRAQGGGLVSLMALLRTDTLWERLLVPPFVFFFKQLYPFSLACRRGSRVAAAAGGCILLETRALEAIGGFQRLRGALIDDCRLAALVKQAGFDLWLGCTRSARSLRGYDRLAGLWRMVRRTAFTQLRYSGALLALSVVAMVTVFVAPFAGLAFGTGSGRAAGTVALVCMCVAFAPTVRLYRQHLAWTLTLPLAALLYLAMTVDSARCYWMGERSRWRGRRYPA